jgi:hypothetical protein
MTLWQQLGLFPALASRRPAAHPTPHRERTSPPNTLIGAHYQRCHRSPVGRAERRISRDGRDQRSSRCATSVPEGERTERRIWLASPFAQMRGWRIQIAALCVSRWPAGPDQDHDLPVGNLQAEIIDRDGAARVVLRRMRKDDHGDPFGESRPSKDTIGMRGVFPSATGQSSQRPCDAQPTTRSNSLPCSFRRGERLTKSHTSGAFVCRAISPCLLPPSLAVASVRWAAGRRVGSGPASLGRGVRRRAGRPG